MSNVGARAAMPVGDFGIFEGEQVKAGTLQFQGQRTADRVVHEGDTLYLLVQAEVRGVAFNRNADGNLVRRHVLRVVEATEAPESIKGSVITVLRSSADTREGKQQLPLDGDDGDDDAEYDVDPGDVASDAEVAAAGHDEEQ